MTNELIAKTENFGDVLAELQQTEQVVGALLKSKHYAKIGPDGIYAIVHKAKSLGINPLDALNGGVYYVQGKVELSSQMMNRLIRSKGHSIQKDEKSTKFNCILHGRRADNGDRWTISFGLDDAKKAGLVKPNGPWEKYTESMCFARALSMLARQLFPDVIIDCYVQGEISDAPNINAPIVNCISDEQVNELDFLIMKDKFPEEATSKICSKAQCNSLSELKMDKFSSVIGWMQRRIKSQKEEIVIEVVEDKKFAEEVSLSEMTAEDQESLFQ